jgi:hypothetical protein
MTDEKSVLLHQLKVRSWNLRWWRGLQLAIWCALGVQLAMIVLIPMREIAGLPRPAYVYFLASIVALGIGGTIGLLAPLSTNLTARFLDAKFHLQERVQSALELVQRADAAPSTYLVQDAIQSLEQNTQRGPLAGLRALSLGLPGTAMLVAILVLGLPPIPPSPWGVSKTELPGVQPGQPPLAEKAESQAPGRDEGDIVVAPHAQVIAAQVAFKDSIIGAEPPDFLSFIKSGDDHLRLLAPEGQGSSPQPRARPIPVQPQEQSRSGATGFESGGLSPEEASARMTEFEDAMQLSSAAARENGQDRPSLPPGPSSSESASKATPSGAAEVSVPGTAAQKETQEQEKGATKEAMSPAREAPGTPSSDDIQRPGLSPTNSTDQDQQAARFGGGQYPHNAPGAAFPKWMQGDEDPHFMDAGQGEGASTGKASGQAGVGHAMLNKGPESPTLRLPRITDFYLPGQTQDGDRTSYETEMLGRGAPSQPSIEHTNVLAQYEFQAEEQMSRNQVPLAFRAQVQNYFSRIQ